MGVFKIQGDQKGSCLVELLVVLVIIGILLSLGIPVLFNPLIGLEKVLSSATI